MNKQAGFTLIELVAVLVILALLGAMAVPRFSSVQSSALSAALDGSSNAVKSAHSIAIARYKRLPTVTELLGEVGGETTVAVATANDGLSVAINGDNYLVPTFTGSSCTGATANATDIVACVGTASTTPIP
jgi:prepilin-type N-terminal cleavage/methylation domain-containing protein